MGDDPQPRDGGGGYEGYGGGGGGGGGSAVIMRGQSQSFTPSKLVRRTATANSKTDSRYQSLRSSRNLALSSPQSRHKPHATHQPKPAMKRSIMEDCSQEQQQKKRLLYCLAGSIGHRPQKAVSSTISSLLDKSRVPPKGHLSVAHGLVHALPTNGQPILFKDPLSPPEPGLGYSEPQHSAYFPPPPPLQPQHHAQAPSSTYEPRRDKPAMNGGADFSLRPRRQYRSYHAPGTQFRSYRGPRGGL